MLVDGHCPWTAWVAGGRSVFGEAEAEEGGSAWIDVVELKLCGCNLPSCLGFWEMRFDMF